jgi:KDO2-lipid IV(A) lauroyltransferase
MVSLPSKLEHKFSALYKPLSNKYFDKLIINLRSKYATGMVPMNDTFKVMLDYKRKNELIITWFLADQTPPRETEYWTRFLNQETPVFLGTEKIARKLNHAVVFMDIHKLKRGYYQAEFTLLFENAKDTKEYEITEKHTKYLENIINQKPEYWLWSHRRWKHKRPENINLR